MITDRNKDGEQQQVRRMEEVKVVKTSMEEDHGSKMKGKTRQRQREGKRTTRTHTSGVKISDV